MVKGGGGFETLTSFNFNYNCLMLSRSVPAFGTILR